MTNDDHELLLSLRRQQTDLRQTLDRLSSQLTALEARNGASSPEALLPSLPPEAYLPPLPVEQANFDFLPPPPAPDLFPTLPSVPVEAAPAPRDPFPLGKTVVWIGALCLVVAFALLASWIDVQGHVHEHMGPLGKLSILGLLATLVMTLGHRLETRKGGMLYIGRALIAAGLGGLFCMLDAAYYIEPLRVIPGPILAGLLLLFWALAVLVMAESRKSQALALFAMALAYVSTAINPVDAFTMGSNLVLAATSAVFLWRRGWTLLATLSAGCAYFASLRRLIIDDNGDIAFETSQANFWPNASYVLVVWFVFTLAVILCKAPAFLRVKRFGIVTLTNAGAAFLLGLTAYISGYGASAIGWTLLDTGLLFLVTSRFAGFAQSDPVDLMGTYAAQGLALVTGGIVVTFNGATRAFLLFLETLMLGVAGAFAGDRILTISTYAAAFFATLFGIWQITAYAHHPWLFGFVGAIILLINAWNCRSEVRNSPVARTSIVFSTACYCVFAIGLVFAALSAKMSDAALPPALGVAALVLTFAIYQVALYELPSLAQILLLAAQVLVLFPADTGEDMPRWSLAWVGAITLIMLTWWSRQRVTRSGAWIGPLKFLYSLALVDIAVLMVRPYVGAQGWMMAAALLAVLFLAYGAFSRAWMLAAVGQFFLALSLYHFFFPPQSAIFPWKWWAAAVPVMAVFAIGRGIHEWLRISYDIRDGRRLALDFAAKACKILALAGLIRWVFGIVPPDSYAPAFLLLGTFLLSWNISRRDSFGVRCSFVLSFLGVVVYLAHMGFLTTRLTLAVDICAFFMLLLQAALLRREGAKLVTHAEWWGLFTLALVANWIFDIWRLSGGYRVIALLLLAVVILSIGFSILRRGGRASSL